MRKPVVFLFSGQGSQYHHMARRLQETQPVFRQTLERLDRTAAALLGESVLEQLYDPSKRFSDAFDRTRWTHPAIFMVEVALAETVRALGIQPDAVIGTSLGEYAAAAVAGVLPAEELLELVIRQALLLEEHAPAGKMITILANPELYHEIPEISNNSEVAGVNYASHFVVACSAERVPVLEDVLRTRGLTFQTLPVSQAFHSAAIDGAGERFRAELRRKSFRRPSVRLISCVSGTFADDLSGAYLWDAVREPIRFMEGAATLQRELGDAICLDLGPGGTLANFLKQLVPPGGKTAGFPVITPFHQEDKHLEQILMVCGENNRLEGERKVEKMIAYLFPGQGSQAKGMGAGLFEEFPELTKQADEILGYSIAELCLEDTRGELGQTQFTQPALYVVNALSYLKKVKETGRKPDYVAGHSLGEYDAMFAAGAFDFATGLRLVQKRGALMSEAKGGGMAAVIGLTEEKIDHVLRENNLMDTIQVANYNSPSQIVIAGLKDDVLAAQPAFEQAEARMYIPLKVSGAFHSKYMAPAQKEFAEFLNAQPFGELTIPVISNVHARPYKQQDLRRNLIEQITHSVKWTDIVRYLLGKGVTEFEEVGPGNVLKGLVRNIQREAEPLIVDEAAEAAAEAAVEAAKAEAAVAVEAPAPVVEAAASAAPAPVVEAAASAAPAPVVDAAAVAAPAPVVESTVVAAQAPAAIAPVPSIGAITATSLGDAQFKADYRLKYAYAAGSMHKGISSQGMVVKMARAGMLAFLGTSGLSLEQVRSAVEGTRRELANGETFGVNVPYSMSRPEDEEQLVDLLLAQDMRLIEASGFLSITPALVRYRLRGLKREGDGRVTITHRIFAKVSRPEVAEIFLTPAPERILQKLIDEGKITPQDADLLRRVPMADELVATADGGGYTDQAVLPALLPTIRRLRDDLKQKYGYAQPIRVGAAGGIGTPEAAAAAFVMGADFLLTGSINQATVEAATSDVVKDLLQEMNVQDTEYAPDEAMFEIGGKVQVLKKGLFFPARANKLHDLYRHYGSWNEIDEKLKAQLEGKYFKRSFEDAYQAAKGLFPASEIEKAERNPKSKLALVFRWYLAHANDLALAGQSESKVDFQVYCGPALGAFNQWVKGTQLESWRNRHVDAIGEHLLNETAALLAGRLQSFFK
jgi:trans-AT polyketide synthase, acyltransferase and oxidoreductase domains